MVSRTRASKASPKSSTKLLTKKLGATIKKPLKSGKISVNVDDDDSVSVALSAIDLNKKQTNHVTIKKPIKSGKKSVKDDDDDSDSVALSAIDVDVKQKKPLAIKKPSKSGKKSAIDDDDDSVSVEDDDEDSVYVNEKQKKPFADITNSTTNRRDKGNQRGKATKKVNIKNDKENMSPIQTKRALKPKIRKNDVDIRHADSRSDYSTADDGMMSDEQGKTSFYSNRRQSNDEPEDWRVMEVVDY